MRPLLLVCLLGICVAVLHAQRRRWMTLETWTDLTALEADADAPPPPPQRRTMWSLRITPPPGCSNPRWNPDTNMAVLDCATPKGKTVAVPVLGLPCQKPVKCGTVLRCFRPPPYQAPPPTAAARPNQTRRRVNPFLAARMARRPPPRTTGLQSTFIPPYWPTDKSFDPSTESTWTTREELREMGLGNRPRHCERPNDYRNTCLLCMRHKNDLFCLCSIPGAQGKMKSWRLRNAHLCGRNRIVRDRKGQLQCV